MRTREDQLGQRCSWWEYSASRRDSVALLGEQKVPFAKTADGTTHNITQHNALVLVYMLCRVARRETPQASTHTSGILIAAVDLCV